MVWVGIGTTAMLGYWQTGFPISLEETANNPRHTAVNGLIRLVPFVSNFNVLTFSDDLGCFLAVFWLEIDDCEDFGAIIRLFS